MVVMIDAAMQATPDDRYGWFITRWTKMDKESRLCWVQRRKAALMVIWVRGGRSGFQGLGIRLSQALADIDR